MTSEAEPASAETVTATVTTTVTATPIEEPTEEATEATLGNPLKVDFGKITALELNPNVTTDPSVVQGLGDERWAGLLVETCVDKGYTTSRSSSGWSPWTLADADNGSHLSLADTTGPNYPEPMYPQLADRTTRRGSCAKGWITFAATASAKLVEAVYEGATVPAAIGAAPAVAPGPS